MYKNLAAPSLLTFVAASFIPPSFLRCYSLGSAA